MFIDVVAAGFTFLALSLTGVWALRSVGRPIDSRIRALAVARQRGSGLASIPFEQRVIGPLIESIGGRFAAMLPGALLKRIERRLIIAGQPMKPAAFYTMALGVGALFGGMYELLIFSARHGRPAPLAVLLGVPVAVVGVYLVMFWLSAQARARQKAMLRSLPNSLDLLTICVEAGLGLDAAFHRVVEKQTGPLVDEIRQMLREIGLGKARRDALLDLAERTGLEDVNSFAFAVIQAEQLGTGLAQVLRAQSDRVRVQRRQRAEQEARRAPVKMAFPLVFCLMPSLFIFILGPIIIDLVGFLNG
jgi:tight adherence protein C